MVRHSHAGTQPRSLADRCQEGFSPAQQLAGDKLYNQGRVLLDDVGADHVDAYISERGRELYISLDWTPARDFGEMTSHCDCEEYLETMSCPHLWALIREMDRQGISAAIRGSGPVLLQDEEFDDGGDPADFFDDDEDDDDIEPPPSRRRASKPRAPKPPDWRAQLRQVRATCEGLIAQESHQPGRSAKPREVHYLVSIEKSRERGKLVVLFFQREGRKDGSWGKIKSLRLEQEDLESVSDPQERRILELLLAGPPDEEYGYYGYSYYGSSGQPSSVVAPALYDIILPQLCATGRLGYSRSKMDDPENIQPLAWDSGPPWRFELEVARDTDRKAWRLEGRLKRDAENLPLEGSLLLLNEGLVVFPECIARLAPCESFAWVVALRRSGVIYVPLAEKDKLIEELWQAPSLPPLELDKELRWEQVSVTPQPKVRIFSPKHRYQAELLAKVTFDYDGQVVGMQNMQSGLVDRQRLRIVLRNRELEADWLKHLHRLGFRPPPYFIRDDSDLQLAAGKLPNATRELLRAGWQVEAEGKLFRRPGEFRLSVTSGVDWFDLEAMVDFGGVSVGLPKLLEAMRKGEQFIALGDGTQGVLPEEWLKKYGMLADLGEAEGDKLRFVPSQAAILDALLAAQPQVQIDQRFEEVRQRLRSFQGVQPAQPPQTFHGQLREYQTHGLGWLHFLRDFQFGGCLADDMGLGKTVQVLALLEARRLRQPNGKPRNPSLVVVPRSLVFNWLEEAKRFTPELRVLNYTGLDRKSALPRMGEHDLLVTTYGTLRRDVLALQELKFDYVILDEAQAVKNAASQASKACRLVQADHRLAMSGTPIENHLGELWSLFEFLNPGMLGRSPTLKVLASGADQDNRSLLAQALRPFILRRTKEQVLTELPEKTEQTLYCELDDAQRKHYDELRDHYRASLDQRIQQSGLKKSKIHVLEALLRLRQAACHPGLLDKAKVKESSAKLETLLEQLSEVLDEGHKALVFSQFTSLLTIVRQQLDRQKIVYEYLDGRTRNRQEKVERFQNDPSCPLFLISLKAGGQGLNLTAADYVFILDPWWNPAVEAQAVDRAHRIGQERRVFAYRLIARDTVEEKILQLQGTKLKLAEAIISEDNSLISGLTADDLRLLLS